MRRDEWARLAAPFPPQALTWRVARLDPDGGKGRLEPVLEAAALTSRLDEVVGVDGWSKRLIPLGSDGVACELEVLGVHKSALARSFGGRIDVERVCDWALGRAAELFGMVPERSDGAWVDVDTDSWEPLYLPEPATLPERYPLAMRDGADVAAHGIGAAGEVPAELVMEAASEPVTAGSETPRSEGQQAIERLVDRLRAEGMGRQAASLVVAHGGYGRTPDEARLLYRELRALLLEKDAVS